MCKYYWLLLFLPSCVGCSQVYINRGCDLDQVEDGLQITCYGKNGDTVGQYTIPKGNPGEQGPKGDTGSTGAPGVAGPKGDSGVTYVPEVHEAGADICPDASESPTGVFGKVITLTPTDGSSGLAVTICNGSEGKDGADGQDAPPTPFMPTELVDPCGDSPTAYDEVLIRMANGILLATVSDNANGQNTRLSRVMPGTWMTTDGDQCIFTVNANNQITYESHRW